MSLHTFNFDSGNADTALANTRACGKALKEFMAKLPFAFKSLTYADTPDGCSIVAMLPEPGYGKMRIGLEGQYMRLYTNVTGDSFSDNGYDPMFRSGGVSVAIRAVFCIREKFIGVKFRAFSYDNNSIPVMFFTRFEPYPDRANDTYNVNTWYCNNTTNSSGSYMYRPSDTPSIQGIKCNTIFTDTNSLTAAGVPGGYSAYGKFASAFYAELGASNKHQSFAAADGRQFITDQCGGLVRWD